MRAEAPAAWAFAAFTTYAQVRAGSGDVPRDETEEVLRLTPAGRPVRGRVGGRTESTPWTGAVTSPAPVNETKSPSNAGRDPATKTWGSGAVSCSTGGEASVNDSTNVNSSRLTSYPAASALFTTYATEAS